MSNPVFISYSSKDRDIAETICHALEARQIPCWISCRDVGPGENFQEAIVHALRRARVMLLVFTSNANNSDEIKKEVVLASQNRVTVVPVRVEDVLPNDALAYEFATRQWVDLFKNWEEEIEHLSVRVADLVATGNAAHDGAAAADTAPAAAAAPAVTAPRPYIHKSKSRRLPLWAVGAFVVLVAALAASAFFLRPWSQTPTQQNAAPDSADTAAWSEAEKTHTIEAYKAYLKRFPAGTHAEDAQLRLADLILTAPATGKQFDGAWSTAWSCVSVGRFPGYAYRLDGIVKDGAYHALKGRKGDPGSFELDGKVQSDGEAAFFGEIIVGSSTVALGAPVGTPSDFHVLAQFSGAAGTGKRIEGRSCSISLLKQ